MSETNGKYPCAYIPDGYTRTAYVAPVEGQHPGCEFTYRPMLVDQVNSILILKDKHPERDVTVTADATSKHLVSWNLVDPKGEPVPVTPSAYRRLGWGLFWSIANMVMGLKPSDKRPGESSDDDDATDVEHLLTAAMGGAPAAVIAEDSDVKNSATG